MATEGKKMGCILLLLQPLCPSAFKVQLYLCSCFADIQETTAITSVMVPTLSLTESGDKYTLMTKSGVSTR